MPFPKETPQTVVEHLARRTLEVLAFVRADRHGEREYLRMELSPQVQWRAGRANAHVPAGGGVTRGIFR